MPPFTVPTQKYYRQIYHKSRCLWVSTNRSHLLYEIWKKLGHTDLNPERMYLYMIDLARNEWKHILRNEISQKFLFKIFCYNNQGTWKTKDFLKISNRKISFTLQCNNTKCIKTYEFISWQNFMEGYHNLSLGNCGSASGLKLKYR